MLHLLGWIILGGAAGWLASVIMGRNSRQGCLMDVVVGIVGAFIGGIAYNLLSGNGFSLTEPLSITSLVGFAVAVGGAVVLLLIVKLVTRPR